MDKIIRECSQFVELSEIAVCSEHEIMNFLAE